MLRELALVAAGRERNACELFYLGGVVFIYWVGRKVLMSFLYRLRNRRKISQFNMYLFTYVCMYVYLFFGGKRTNCFINNFFWLLILDIVFIVTYDLHLSTPVSSSSETR